MSYPLSEKECVKVGGHCYELLPEVLCSIPPQYIRVCKHCGHQQIGMEQPDIAWRDAGGKHEV
jgi:hypothetical protein